MNEIAKLTGMLVLTTALAGPAFAATELSMWYHGAGGESAERDTFARIIKEFNESQSDWEVKLQAFPQIAYNDAITAAAVAGKLPDIIDVDGPIMPNWAWSKYMQPLPIPEEKFAKFLPGTLGHWDGKLYSVGLWDAAVAMYARKSVLEENGIRIPTLDKPWTAEEFDTALVKLKDSGKFDYPLDLGMNDKGEWYPYAFSPFLQSFGGDIVDRSTYKTAEGALNGEAAVKFGTWWQSLFSRKLAPGTSQDTADHDTGFLDGKYALQWNGNWAALKPLDKFGDDTLFLPAPDFGHGSKIGAASWQLGISAASKHADGAAKFIEFATQDKYLAAFSNAIGLIPATAEAAQMTDNYKDGGKLAVFYELSAKQALVRPVTPGYVFAAKEFRKALSDIADGADVQDTLDAAADAITADIEKNSGYGH